MECLFSPLLQSYLFCVCTFLTRIFTAIMPMVAAGLIPDDPTLQPIRRLVSLVGIFLKCLVLWFPLAWPLVNKHCWLHSPGCQGDPRGSKCQSEWPVSVSTHPSPPCSSSNWRVLTFCFNVATLNQSLFLGKLVQYAVFNQHLLILLPKQGYSQFSPVLFEKLVSNNLLQSLVRITEWRGWFPH